MGYAIQNRQVGQHDLNLRSTRSHCITEIYIDLPGQAALRSVAAAAAPGLRGKWTTVKMYTYRTEYTDREGNGYVMIYGTNE